MKYILFILISLSLIGCNLRPNLGNVPIWVEGEEYRPFVFKSGRETSEGKEILLIGLEKVND